MRKLGLLSLVAATSLFATNGDNLIGVGAQSRALGGTGIAMYQGSENALTNPALLGKTASGKGEMTVGGTFFKADVSASTTAGANAGGGAPGVTKDSAVGMSVIPYISYANRSNENITFGFGLYGTAGMGTDYTGDVVNPGLGQTKLYNMKSELQILQIAPSIAYNKDNYGVGLTAILQYGKLSIDFDASPGNGVTGVNHVGDNKMSSDTGFGFSVGGYYDLTKDATVAVMYKSAIDMVYGNEISDAAFAFGYDDANASHLPGKTDHLEQPAEYGIGISIDNNYMTYTVDFRTIKWGSAKGYKDFGWVDQNVIALGAKYKVNGYWLGLGYNSSNNPIPNNKDATFVNGVNGNKNGDTMNVFNYVMFPATITSAYTIGGGYTLSSGSSIDYAYTYMPKVSDTVSGATVGVGDLTTKHSQQALTIAYKFTF